METQSLFFARLLDDPAWLSRYARASDGAPMTEGEILGRVARRQPFRVLEERLILAVAYFERALYALDDSEMTPDRVLGLARETERRVLGVESPRPLLAIPNLLTKEGSAIFHGFLLANMAVSQTRAWLLRDRGSIVDDPGIGPLLARNYWAPGNSRNLDSLLRDLTGEGLSAATLAEECGRDPELALREAEEALSSARARRGDPPAPLEAAIAITDGDETIADNASSDAEMCEAFASYVRARYPAGAG